jgi:gentisate 1,2-dioxygenase
LRWQILRYCRTLEKTEIDTPPVIALQHTNVLPNHAPQTDSINPLGRYSRTMFRKAFKALEKEVRSPINN